MKAVKLLFVSNQEYANLRKNDKESCDAFYQEICHKGGRPSKHKSFKIGFPKDTAGWYIVDDKAGRDFMKLWSDIIDNAQIEVDKTPTEIVPKQAKKAEKAEASEDTLANLIVQYNTLTSKSKKTEFDKKLISKLEAKIDAL